MEAESAQLSNCYLMFTFAQIDEGENSVMEWLKSYFETFDLLLCSVPLHLLTEKLVLVCWEMNPWRLHLRRWLRPLSYLRPDWATFGRSRRQFLNTLWAILNNVPIGVKTDADTLAKFWKRLGYLLFQHLVTLASIKTIVYLSNCSSRCAGNIVSISETY